MRHKFLALMSLLLLAGCISTEQKVGYLLNEEKLAEIHPGETTRREVSALLGTPTTRSQFEVERWHYIGEKAKLVGVLDPDVVEQTIVTIEFNSEGVVEKLERKGVEDRKPVEMVSRTTPSEGVKFGVMQQIIGNFGKFNKGKTGQDVAQ